MIYLNYQEMMMSEQRAEQKLRDQIKDLQSRLDAESYFKDYQDTYLQMLVAHLYVEDIMTYKQLRERHYLNDETFSEWFQGAIGTYYYRDPVKLNKPAQEAKQDVKDMFARLKKQTNNE